MAEIGLFEAMFSARALRRLKPDPVPDELISKIIEAGTQAASGGSEQHWLFVVVKDPAQRKRIAEIYPQALAVMGPYLKMAKIPPHLTEKQRNVIRKGAGYLFQHLAEVPVLIFACLKPQEGVDPAILPPEVLAKTGWTDRLLGASIYPAVENMILACRALELGTVLTFIHTLKEDDIKRVLGLPREISTYAMLPVGYPIDKFGPVKRKPVREVTCLDRYGNPWPG
ncbi:MAG TPA: nitroreductase family protein [Candidatus Binataceae bacterium]|jgi:nitroreductase|nr:nitroreductase family protein [Candidatus Binataceae bacterium]